MTSQSNILWTVPMVTMVRQDAMVAMLWLIMTGLLIKMMGDYRWNSVILTKERTEDVLIMIDVVVRDFGFFLPSDFLSVLINTIFSNSDFLSGIPN